MSGTSSQPIIFQEIESEISTKWNAANRMRDLWRIFRAENAHRTMSFFLTSNPHFFFQILVLWIQAYHFTAVVVTDSLISESLHKVKLCANFGSISRATSKLFRPTSDFSV